jgi:sulfite reductase alpha subunit-like flavoprotein
MEQVTVADIFGMFPSVRIDFPSFFQIAPVNAPRYYTVSSSHKFSPHTVSITLGLREVKGKPLPRCSSYLAALAPGTDSVRASFLRSSFVFPYHDRRPIMLVSAGTGIAPFRAFIQDLEYEQDLGKGADDGAKDGVVEPSQQQQRRRAFLFYGCRSPGTDFLYSSDIKRALADGILDQVHIEFSESADESSSSVRPKRVRRRRSCAWTETSENL